MPRGHVFYRPTREENLLSFFQSEMHLPTQVLCQSNKKSPEIWPVSPTPAHEPSMAGHRLLCFITGHADRSRSN